MNLEDEQRKLVIARLKTLNPESKVLFGDSDSVSVKEMISHVEAKDSFGDDIVKAQMRMLKVLANVKW